MIYFAELPTGSIKIGHTADLSQRVIGLKTHYKVEPAILLTMEGDRQTEREMHDRFSHLRLGRTEQFRPGRDLLEFIGKPSLVGINPDAVESHDAKPIRLVLPPDAVEELDRIASTKGLNRASMARMAVMEWLESRRGQK